MLVEKNRLPSVRPSLNSRDDPASSRFSVLCVLLPSTAVSFEVFTLTFTNKTRL